MNSGDRYNDNGSQTRAILIVLALMALGFGWLQLYLRGSIVILDADGVINQVILRDSSRQVIATHLVNGLYAANPHLEGEALIRCRNGHQIDYGYYTSGTHIWQTIRASDCGSARPSTNHHRVSFLYANRVGRSAASPIRRRLSSS